MQDLLLPWKERLSENMTIDLLGVTVKLRGAGKRRGARCEVAGLRSGQFPGKITGINSYFL